MIIVTGGAGFIGSNLVKALNQRGRQDIIVVDDLKDGRKFRNLVDCQIADYLDREDFLDMIGQGIFDNVDIEVIFHQGACSTTTEWDGRYMMAVNYDYSKSLLHFCQDKHIPFIYASSAAVYGDNQTFIEDLRHESPLNVYGYSKFLFDQYVRKQQSKQKAQVVGLRYFNVYGPNEQHKAGMASVAYHLHSQLLSGNKVQLFAGYDGYGNGEQTRDFIYVGDAVKVNLWFWDNPDKSGIFNCGTGRSQPFKDVANAVIDFHQRGTIEYIPFPDKLKGCYQSFTQADISALRNAGYNQPFLTVEQGVHTYLKALAQ